MKREIKILSIDGEEIILKSVQKALKENTDTEYIITTCNTAVEGLKSIRNDTFNLVLIDLFLPGMDGLEVLRRIKKIDPSVPVIIMTGFSPVNLHPGIKENTVSLDEALKNTAGFLLKPFTTNEIRDLIRGVLK